MQPWMTIPPYVPGEVEKIVGTQARAPKKNGRGYWWVDIKEVFWCSEREAVVTVKGFRASGRAWKVYLYLSSLRFRNHCDDPLVLALHRARGLSKSRGDQEPHGVSSCASPHV